MKHGSAINWLVRLADSLGMRAAVWDFLEGCSPEGIACLNCWAADEVDRRGHQKGKVGERFAGLTTRDGDGRARFNGILRVIERDIDKPSRTKRPTVFFVDSRSDLFHPSLPDEVRDRAFCKMALYDRHLYVLLTKRPALMRAYVERLGLAVGRDWTICHTTRRRRGRMPWRPVKRALPLPNVLVGTTVWDQASADRARGPMKALADAGWRTWVSSEPRLGPIDWTGWEFVTWLETGGESGKRGRPMHPDWPRADRAWCAARGIPWGFKQWGAWAPLEQHPGRGDWMIVDPAGDVDIPDNRWPDKDAGEVAMVRVGKEAAGRILDGELHDGVPA